MDNTEKKWIVKKYHPEHRCYSDNRNKLVSTRYVAMKFRNRILTQRDISTKTLQQLFREELNCDVTRVLMYKAKRLVLAEVECDIEKDFKELWNYLEELKSRNNGTFILKTIKD